MDPAPSPKTNLYGLDRDQLADALGPDAGPRYRVAQLYRAIYRQPERGIEGWTALPTDLRESLARRFEIRRPEIVRTTPASDGTRKFLLRLAGGGEVEAVAIPATDRMTFCVSSQIGCAFGCAFCMTARLGLVRHLQAGEIVGQIDVLARETERAEGEYNVVFMGMGEPLHNYDGVSSALKILTDPEGLALGPRRITVSTVGIPKGILRLAAEETVPRLAVSLVCADPEVRERLMPAARAHSLDQLADAIRAFGNGKRDRPTLEVVLLRGVNDAREHAHALARFARRSDAKVNLIEFNETPELEFEAPDERTIDAFMRVLNGQGVTATVRRSRGKDADAACGQLAFTERAKVGIAREQPEG